MIPALAALGIAGGGINFLAGLDAGEQADAAAQYNAALLDLRAEATMDTARSEAELMQERNRKLTATQENVMTKGGGRTDVGSNLLLLSEQAGDMQRDVLEHMRNRSLEARGFRSQASQTRFAGSQAKRASQIGSLGTLLGTVGNVGQLYDWGSSTSSGVPDYSNPNFMSPLGG